MKAIRILTISICAFSISTLSQAQTNAPVTRAGVRADLISVEKTGYNPAANDSTAYPSDIQAAEAKVAKQNEGQQPAYVRSAPSGVAPRVAQNAPRECVGPRSFCQIYADS